MRATTKLLRGYLILEAMVGGAIVAVALGTCIGLIGHYRLKTSMAIRRAEASQIAIAEADKLMTRATTGSAALAPVPNHPGFRSSWAVDPSGIEGNSVPPIVAGDLFEIVVRVEFPCIQSSAECVAGRQTLEYRRYKKAPN
jgi:hypothetical protein